jgi:hypothetical protein
MHIDESITACCWPFTTYFFDHPNENRTLHSNCIFEKIYSHAHSHGCLHIQSRWLKSKEHLVFSVGLPILPSKPYPDPTLLYFGDLTRTSAFNLVWPRRSWTLYLRAPVYQTFANMYSASSGTMLTMLTISLYYKTQMKKEVQTYHASGIHNVLRRLPDGDTCAIK